MEELDPSGPCHKNTGQFVAARQLSGHSIATSDWDKTGDAARKLQPTCSLASQEELAVAHLAQPHLFLTSLISSAFSPFLSSTIHCTMLMLPVGRLVISAFIPHTHIHRPSNLTPPTLPFPLPQQPSDTSPLPSSLFPFNSGRVVVIDDHIRTLPLLTRQVTRLNPLRGPVYRSNVAPFVPLSDAYAHHLRLTAFRAVHDLGLQRSLARARTHGSARPRTRRVRRRGCSFLLVRLSW